MIKKAISLLLLLLISFSICGCSSEKEEKKYSSIDEIDGSVIGVLSGTVFDSVAKVAYPNSEIKYFLNNGDAVQALKEKRIDAYINDDIQVIQLCKEEKDLAFFGKSLQDYDYAFAFPKTNEGKALRDDFNIFLNELSHNGTTEEIINKWVADSTSTIDYSLLTGVNGTLTLATDSTCHPMAFNINNEYVGIDVEIAYLYCLNRGYNLEIKDYTFENIIPTITNSKADFAGAGIMVTSEREDSVYFSSSYYRSGSYVTVLKENYEKKPEDLNDFAGKKIGVLAGGIGGEVVRNNIKDPTVIEIESVSDMLTELKNGKVDAIAQSEISFKPMLQEDPAVKIVCPVYIETWAFGFEKSERSDELRNQFNEFITTHNENREFQAIYEEWENTETVKTIDYQSLEGERTLEVAVCSGAGAPNCYYVGQELTGYEIDLYTRFAREYGYKIHFSDYNFPGMLAAISSGKADVGGVTLAVTDERKESVNFSDSYLSGYFVIGYYDQDDVSENTSFLQTVSNSFNKTFIREDRYKLFIDGIVSTTIISLSAIIIGSLLGLLLFILFRRNINIINSIINAYTFFINGTPTVVLLMVFFYIIFTNEMYTSTMVAIFTFIAIFSVKVLGLLQMCLSAVDKGQYDAAYGLGYSKRQTFMKIIGPQIAPMFLPAFNTEIIALLKSTSVVGYIAVQDLTKMSDIVRSRTYESFFPLVVTTIFYFLIAFVFTSIIKYLLNKIDPRRHTEKDIFKGVKRYD